MTQVSVPVQGEVLAGRYRLDDVLSTEPGSERTLWRGTDTLLNRRVAIELRIPGGPAAQPMIGAAMAAGRIIHPGIAGVYDAVDEGERAFVVREWVDGSPLHEALREGVLEPVRAASIICACADALAAAHATAHSHGNIAPNTVLLSTDDSVTLVGLRLGPASSQPADIRALGALLYATLTGRWPREVPFGEGLPDAMRADGRMCSPRQTRAGIPNYLDALTMDLLDPAIPPPTAAELADELRRYDIADPDLGALSTIGAELVDGGSRWKRFGVLITGLVVISVGVAVGILGLLSFWNVPMSPTSGVQSRPSASALALRTLGVTGAQIIDSRGVIDEADAQPEKAVDGNPSTAWKTDTYRGQPDFGGIEGKKGIGIAVDLGDKLAFQRVTVRLTQPGATVELRVSDSKASTEAGYRRIGNPKENAGGTVTFEMPPETQAQYVLIWITKLPLISDNQYQVGITDIIVEG